MLAAVEIPYTPVTWIATYSEGLENLESLLMSALKTIRICAFALHLSRAMPSGQTLADVINRKAMEGVDEDHDEFHRRVRKSLTERDPKSAASEGAAVCM